MSQPSPYSYHGPTAPVTDTMAHVVAVLPELGPQELEVLALVAERLLMGQRTYGLLGLEHDQRDFDREALEEFSDGLIYAACSLLKRRGAREV